MRGEGPEPLPSGSYPAGGLSCVGLLVALVDVAGDAEDHAAVGRRDLDLGVVVDPGLARVGELEFDGVARDPVVAALSLSDIVVEPGRRWVRCDARVVRAGGGLQGLQVELVVLAPAHLEVVGGDRY